jgi:geranylgeranyl diphosphate synthase type II
LIKALDLAFAAEPVNLQGYLDIASAKSGSLLALPLELVMITCNRLTSLPIAKQAGESFAIAYQIADDLNDVEDDLARGTCNIVGVLQRRDVDRSQATREALDLMQKHLRLAEYSAAQLPAESGAYLLSLCGKLSVEEA